MKPLENLLLIAIFFWGCGAFPTSVCVRNEERVALPRPTGSESKIFRTGDGKLYVGYHGDIPAMEYDGYDRATNTFTREVDSPYFKGIRYYARGDNRVVRSIPRPEGKELSVEAGPDGKLQVRYAGQRAATEYDAFDEASNTFQSTENAPDFKGTRVFARSNGSYIACLPQPEGNEVKVTYLGNVKRPIQVQYRNSSGGFFFKRYDEYNPRDRTFRRNEDTGPFKGTVHFGRGDGYFSSVMGYLRVLNQDKPSRVQFEPTPVSSFILTSPEAGIPTVWPRPNAVSQDVGTVDHNNAFDTENFFIRPETTASGRTAILGSHGAAKDGSLSGLSDEQVVKMLQWMKGKGFDSVLIEACHQNKRRAWGLLPSGPNSHIARIVKLMRQEDPGSLPNVFLPETNAVGETYSVSKPGHPGVMTIAVKDAEGAIEDQGDHYREVNFNQRIWPPKSNN